MREGAVNAEADRIREILKKLPKEDAQVISSALAEGELTQRKLRESKERMRTWLEGSPACTKILDLDFNLQYMSHAGVAGLGIDDVTELYGKPYPFHFFPEAAKEEMRANLARAKETKEVISKEGPVYDMIGNELWFHATIVPICDEQGNVIYLMVVSVETTDRRRAEQQLADGKEQLLQSQKMEAVGQLAGGVAHDFNNVLGGIIGATELLQDTIPDTADVDNLCEIILESANKAGDLTARLLAFTRKQPSVSMVIDVHHAIGAALELLRNSVDRRIRFTTALDASSSNIVGDPSQLQNSIMNLAINSSHAMPDGGTISITSRTTELDDFDCKASLFDIKPGLFIEIELRDTGAGIPPEDLPRIFDPFFTTKGQGKGTGLGLATVFGTVRQHGGAITAYSEIGRGTSMRIELPLTEARVHGHPPCSDPVHGSGTILLVDDEPVILSTTRGCLTRLGYSVQTAENGAIALELYRKTPETFDLVLLDMIMPVMSGKECFEELREIRPTVNVVLASGFTQEDDLDEMKQNGLRGFISKPYRRGELSRVIHHAMQDARPSPAIDSAQS